MLQIWSFFFKGVRLAGLLGSGFGGLILSSFAQELLRVCRNDARPRKGNTRVWSTARHQDELWGVEQGCAATTGSNVLTLLFR